MDNLLEKKHDKKSLKLQNKENKKLASHKKKIQKDIAKKTTFQKLKSWWPFSKISGKIIIGYLSAIIIGGFLLSIPGIVNDRESEWNFITGMFTASSAISDTGITILQTNTQYSLFGQILILVMIKIGGIGLLTIKLVILALLNRKISLDDQHVAKSERGTGTVANTVEMIRDAFLFLTFIEIAGTGVLFFGFYLTPLTDTSPVNTSFDVTDSYHNFSRSLWASIFHSVSAVNNAGFDIISNSSLQPYNQGNNRGYVLQVIFMLQWIIGGLGYPTYHDIKRKIKARKEGKKVKFSLFTKLNFVFYTILLVVGPTLVILSEVLTVEKSKIMYRPTETEGVYEKQKTYQWVFDIIFNVTSCRNAGFSTVDINNFTAGSKFVMAIWMFIGAAPSSTAGGIRTTTFAICLIAIISIIRNKHSVEAFKKKVPDETVRRSFAVIFLSFFIVVFSIFVVYLDSNKMLYDRNMNTDDTEYTIIQLIVYVSSAFGTVGFQPFANSEILAMGVVSKIMLVLTMFIGQLGISNTLLAFVKPKNKQNFGYLEEEVTIG
ncbi:TrkH family potassium uptake protein [Spiroplasma tabanidicola]|uniref:Potassium uptake protein KtrB n=1 Tax=Spiroplasma tabanidicola TaxID=324079 RepID=A0A6I6CC89_9MOLU|nr:potassium transporter TrkG [Spiroplasma tabanidicola]QGS51574.1 potassium uptake protein KtrB [Spiroplasma tabanidicola]